MHHFMSFFLRDNWQTPCIDWITLSIRLILNWGEKKNKNLNISWKVQILTKPTDSNAFRFTFWNVTVYGLLKNIKMEQPIPKNSLRYSVIINIHTVTSSPDRMNRQDRSIYSVGAKQQFVCHYLDQLVPNDSTTLINRSQFWFVLINYYR